MGEDTRDKERFSTGESKKSKSKITKVKGWIWMHQEENTKLYPADEQLDEESVTS